MLKFVKKDNILIIIEVSELHFRNNYALNVLYYLPTLIFKK